MICFHFTIFVVLETTKNTVKILCACCDLLSFYYLCRTGNNGIAGRRYGAGVVICFHFTIFVVLETTCHTCKSRIFSLWFAFILLSLSYWKQRYSNRMCLRPCCDLLSFYYLCRTGNNGLMAMKYFLQVVICFHFTIFVVLETTFKWFWYWLHCCDLLSFYYLCRTGNNWGSTAERKH